MKNITLAVDDEVLDKVRVYAAENQTTVNAIVRQHFERIAGENDKRVEARRNLRRLAESSTARLGPDYVWNRDEIYERPVLRRHEHSRLRGKGEGG